MTARSPLRALLWPGIATAICLCILLGLGAWQIERLTWKQDLIAKVEARIHAPVQPAPEEANWGAVDFDEDEYRHVTATGRFLHDREVQVYALIDEGVNGAPGGPGYWVVTPLELADGAVILVNRGFVSPPFRDPATRTVGQVGGVVTVSGLLRLPEAPAMFQPANDPAKGQWFVRDPIAIADAKGLLRVAPFLIDADGAPNPGGWPLGGQTRITFPNRHLEYALTWFGLAATLAGVFIAFAVARLRRRV
ncbi:SURF1 family protein [Ancylobacter sp. G4_0304]|uniref:SURF1 family protein n=1 Tax=Ancylobacter sp. G4_0304 TaxID=3114289 RepID=UPI0039C69AC9